ncbi:MAG TPA: hypothetical protein DCP97_02675 [Ruminococcaceae bacterium]|nr:hypothetical protein [Oscillospiraceae bacterium]
MRAKHSSFHVFGHSADGVHNRVRGRSPWPVAYTKLDGKLLKIYKTAVVSGKGRAGEIIDEKSFIVACGENAVQLLEVQFEGGKRMSAAEFLRGKRLVKSTVLPDGQQQ